MGSRCNLKAVFRREGGEAGVGGEEVWGVYSPINE